ncbi:MAG: anti-sigma factor [Anaerolineales bacterium]
MTEHVDELLALYALGGLEPEAREHVEAHLAVCATCRKEAAAMQALVGLVAQSAPPVEPRRELRSSILRRIRPKSQPAPAPVAQPRRPALAWAFAALGAVLTVGLLGWNLSLNAQLGQMRQQMAGLQQQVATQSHVVADLQEQTEAQQEAMDIITAPDTRAIELAGQGTLADASGRAYVSLADSAVVLVANDLRPLGADQTYQAWVIPANGPPVSAGLFTVNEAGWAMTTLAVPESLKDFSAIGVSLEPAGGSEQPTEVVLVGGL